MQSVYLPYLSLIMIEKHTVRSRDDLWGSHELQIPDQLKIDKPADLVVWLQENYGHIYEFGNPRALILELVALHSQLCRQEMAKARYA